MIMLTCVLPSSFEASLKYIPGMSSRIPYRNGTLSQIARLMLKEPVDATQLIRKLGVSQASAYRYLAAYRDPKSDLRLVIDGLKWRLKFNTPKSKP